VTDKMNKSRRVRDFIAREINVNNCRRNLIKSRDVTCRSDAFGRKSHCVTAVRKKI